MGENKYNVFPAWDISILSRNKLSKNKDYHSGSLFAFFSLCCLLQILGSICLSPSTYAAHTATLTTSGTVNVDVSVSGTGASIAEDELTITSTCPLGYTVSISGPNDRTLYRNGNSSNNTTEQTITASTGTTSNPASILGNNLGTWGYALGDNITTSSNFIGLASTANTIITKNTASATGGDIVSVYYGVSVHPNQVPGLYTMAESQAGAGDNVITYYLTTSANCDNYIIKYNDNNANSSTTMTGMTHPVVENDEVTLAASNYQRAGYGFAGWSTVQLDPNSASFATNLQSAVTAGKVFGPNETITINQALLNQAVLDGGTQVIAMYAIWVKPATNPSTNQPETLQDWICPNNTNMPVGTVVALKDSRDNNTYAVAKLADGKCWMIENLRLDNTATIDSTNTNNPATGFALSTPQDPTTNPWCTDQDSACINQSMLATNNTTNTVSDMSSTDQNIYSYGNYYNWYSATAGNGTTNTPGNADAVGSICPAGWHLPTGGGEERTNNSNFRKLAVSTIGFQPNVVPDDDLRASYSNIDDGTIGTDASNTMRSFPNNTLFSGAVYYEPAELVGRGWAGDYWASTKSFYFVYEEDVLYPGTVPNRPYRGYSVRCVANATIQYDDNGANSSTTMGEQVVEQHSDEVILWASNFKRSGYGFAGWNTKADGTGTSYGPNETIDDETTLNSIKNNNLKLYAMWVQSAGNLQNWSGCSNLAIGGVTALTDTRDGNTYAVARLADAKCWMIENLRLGSGATINSTNTNNPASGFTLAAPQDPTTNAWCTAMSSACFDQSMLAVNNTTGAVSVMTNPDQNVYGYGNYYNWYAATAGNGVYSITSASGATQGDICPAGWFLPYGGFDTSSGGGKSIGGFGYLDIKLGNNGSVSNASTNPTGVEASKAWRSYPNNYTYAGGLKGNAIDYRGGRGYYKSSMPGGDETVAYSVRLMGDEVDPGQLYNYKDGGGSVRCVATNPEPNTITFDLSWVSTSNTIPDQQYIAGDPNAVLTSEVPIASSSNKSPNLAFLAWETMDAPTGGVYRIAPGGSIPTSWNSDMTLYESFRDTSITNWSVSRVNNNYVFGITSSQTFSADEITFYIWKLGNATSFVSCTRSGTTCQYTGSVDNYPSGYYLFHVYYRRNSIDYFYGNTMFYLN